MLDTRSWIHGEWTSPRTTRITRMEAERCWPGASLSPANAAVAVGMTDPPPSGVLPPPLKLWRAGHRTGGSPIQHRTAEKNCSLHISGRRVAKIGLAESG
jgi:hypothetical protein